MSFKYHYHESSPNELYHYGVLGMKWGVRRYQNKDGSLTAAGKAHRRTDDSGSSPKRKVRLKKVALATVLVGTAAAGAIIYSRNSEAINRVVAKAGNTALSAIKNGGSKAVKKGKHYVSVAAKQAVAGVKEGVKEGLKEAPKKAVKTVMAGAAVVAAKKLLDSTVGKEESARVFQAANPKKVSSFWKVQPSDVDEDKE